MRVEAPPYRHHASLDDRAANNLLHNVISWSRHGRVRVTVADYQIDAIWPGRADLWASVTARVHESNRSSFIIRQLAVNVIVYTVLVKSSSIHRVFLSPEAFLLYGIAKNSEKMYHIQCLRLFKFTRGTSSGFSLVPSDRTAFRWVNWKCRTWKWGTKKMKYLKMQDLHFVVLYFQRPHLDI